MMTVLKGVVAAAVVAMAASAVVAYSILTRADRAGLLVVESHRALAAVEEALRRSLDAEVSVRNYVVTRDRADLGAFERASETIQHTLDDLQRYTEGEPERQRVQRLRAEVDGLFVTLQSQMAPSANASERRSEGRDESRARLAAIRVIVREIRRAERDRLAKRMAADAAATRFVNWFATLTAAFAAALAAASAALVVFVIRPGWGR